MSVLPPRDRPSEGTDGLEWLGAYLLLEERASGELCSVHLAQSQDEAAETPTVIIKRLHRRHMLDPERRLALQRQVEIAAKLDSPRIVRTLFSDDDPQPYLVMEQLDGATLSALLSRASQPLDLQGTRHLIPLIVDALQGLADLHGGHPQEGAHYIHQAPCARHIMACSDGHARIIDLTLAMDTTQPRSRLCDERLLPAEMAPEQALAPSHLDPRCDLFIVGVTLWEALTGRRLFAADTPQQTLDRMLRSAIMAPSQAGAASGRTFDKVCMRALSRPRRERYASAAEFAAELREEAVRAGLYANPSEVAAWVSETLDAASCSRARHERPGHATIQGIGAPNFALPALTQSIRDSQLDEPTTRVSRPRRVRDEQTSAGMPALLAPSVPPRERGRDSSAPPRNQTAGRVAAHRPTTGFALPRQQATFAMFCLAAVASLALMALFSRDLVRVLPPALNSALDAVGSLSRDARSSSEPSEAAGASSPQPATRRSPQLDPTLPAATPQPTQQAAARPAAAAVQEPRGPKSAETSAAEAALERKAQPSPLGSDAQREIAAPAQAQRPVAPATTQPQAATAIAKPQAATAIAKPQAATAIVKPQPAAAIAKPQTATAIAKPQAAATIAKPQPAAAIAKPQAPVRATPQAAVAKPQRPAAKQGKSALRPASGSAAQAAKREAARPPLRSAVGAVGSEVPLPLLESGGNLRATQFGRTAASPPAPAAEPPALPSVPTEAQKSEGIPINPY